MRHRELSTLERRFNRMGRAAAERERYANTLNARIRALGATKAEIARRCGMHYNQFQHYCDATSVPSPAIQERIERVLAAAEKTTLDGASAPR